MNCGRNTFLAVVGLAVCSLTASAAQPRVMLLVDEKNLGSLPTSEIEAMAVAKLVEQGIPTVDQEMVRANIRKDQLLLRSVGDNRGAAAVGLQFGADVVIVGEAVAKPSARRIAESNLRSYQAAVTLRAVRTDNSENLASASETASAIDIEDVTGGSKALKAAGEKTLGVLIPKMLENWAKSPTSGSGLNKIVLTVGGVDAAWKLKSVRECLRAKAENLTQRSYTAGVAIFDVETSVPARSLSEKVLTEPPEGLVFQVLDVGEGKVDLRAVERKAR
jgi:hypothetical protein